MDEHSIVITNYIELKIEEKPPWFEAYCGILMKTDNQYKNRFPND